MKKLLLLFGLLCLPDAAVWAQIEPSLRFRRYGIEDGLSQVTARCLLEDTVDGHVWIGTQDGLNQFDGYRFKVFKQNDDDPNSLSSNRINTLFQDREGRIWVGTVAGLNLYERRTESFVHITSEPDNAQALSHPNVMAIAQDDAGKLWIGTENGLNVMDVDSRQVKRYFGGANGLSSSKIATLLTDKDGTVWVGTDTGLNRYDAQTDSFSVFRHDATNAHSISSNTVVSLFEDAIGHLWVGTTNGLNLLRKKEDAFLRFTHDPTRPHSLTHGDIRAITQDQQGRIWLGTRWAGINILDLNTREIRPVLNDLADPNSLSNNTVLSMLTDSRGNVWVGVSGTGLNVFNPRTERFGLYKHIANDPYSLLDDGVWGMLRDHEDRLWVVTYEGASIIEPDGTIRHLRHNPKNPKSLSSNQITSIYQDRQQRIWIGTIYGLNLYDPSTDTFTRFVHRSDNPSSVSHDLVWCILEDQQGKLWVGTDEGGLNQLDTQTGKFKRFPFNSHDGRGTNHFRIKCLAEDQNGHLWVGTDQGVNVLNPQTETFTYFTHDPANPNSLASNIVKSIAQDNLGRMFVGTEGGLSLYDSDTGDFINWKEKDGLSNEVIYGILVDDHNNLWLSTNKGINQFDTSNDTFTVYDKHDGLQSDEFNTGSYYKDKDGILYFGGVNGLSFFHPDSIRPNTFVPPVLITDFQLFNESVAISDSTVLAQSLNVTREITLKHDQDIFAFVFAALGFEQPEKIQYAYRLEPFHKDWIYTDYADRKAVLTRIPAGEYTFRVKAANEAGIWGDTSRDLIVTVLPPWYQTQWARGLFLALGLGLVVLVIYVRERNARVIRRRLEETVAEKTRQLKAEKEEVSRQLVQKEILMQEVHHRVKNNLTFLKSLLYLRARASDDKDVRRILDECQARIQSMALVHQNLYDMEDSSKVNFEMFLRELFVQLMVMMEQDADKVDFELDMSEVEIDMKTSVFLGLILNELITNSFKYAFANGKGTISIRVLNTPSAIEIYYSDSGIGLPADFDLSASGGFGFKMIRILSDQLGSHFQYLSAEGKVFKVSVPKRAIAS